MENEHSPPLRLLDSNSLLRYSPTTYMDSKRASFSPAGARAPPRMLRSGGELLRVERAAATPPRPGTRAHARTDVRRSFVYHSLDCAMCVSASASRISRRCPLEFELSARCGAE